MGAGVVGRYVALWWLFVVVVDVDVPKTELQMSAIAAMIAVGSVATARPGPLAARLRDLGRTLGDGPGADLIAYGLGAAVSRLESAQAVFGLPFWE